MALAMMIEIVPKYCTTIRNAVTDFFTVQTLPSLVDFFVAPSPVPGASLGTDELLKNFAMCCLTMLNFFTQHKGLPLGPVVSILDSAALHYKSACIAPVLDMVSHILSKKGAEWMVYDNVSVASALAKNLYVLSATQRAISPAVHVMLSQQAPPELYFNNRDIPTNIACPEIPFIVCANEEQKFSTFQQTCGMQRVLFLEKNTLLLTVQEKFCASVLLHALQRLEDNAILCDMAAAMFHFTSKLDAEPWIYIMSPVLMYMVQCKPIRHNKVVCSAAKEYMPNFALVETQMEWAVPILKPYVNNWDMPGLVGVIRSKLGSLDQTKRLVWPYSVESLCSHVMTGGDIDTVICDQKKWSSKGVWGQYASAFLKCCLEREQKQEFPTNWLYRVTDDELLNRYTEQESAADAAAVLHKLAIRGTVVDRLPAVPLAKLPKMPLSVIRKLVDGSDENCQSRKTIDDVLSMTGSCGTSQRLHWVTEVRHNMHVDPERCQGALIGLLRHEINTQVRCTILGALLEDARLGVWELESRIKLTSTDKLFLALVYTKGFVSISFSVFDFDVYMIMPSWIVRHDKAFEQFILHAVREPVITPLKLLHCIWALKYNVESNAKEAMKTAKRIMTLGHLQDNVSGIGTEYELWRPIYEMLEDALHVFIDVHRAWSVDAATVNFVTDTLVKLAPFSVTHAPHHRSVVKLLKRLSFVRFPSSF